MAKHAKAKLAVKIHGGSVRVRLANSILKFSSIYQVKKRSIQISWIVFLGLVSAIFGVLLVENTGLYDIGLSAISQGIGRISYYAIYNATNNSQLSYAIFNVLFWGIYLLANIPLVIFGWYKIGKNFALLSTLYIFVATAGGLALAFIPGIEDVFILGNLILNDVPILIDHNVQLVFWNYIHDAPKHFPIFVYGVLWGFIQAVVYAVLLIIDCSTGGLDIPAVWYGETRYKDLGAPLAIINIISLVIGYIIGSFVPGSLGIQEMVNNPNLSIVNNIRVNVNTQPWSATLFFSPTFLSSFLTNILLSLVLNILFPKAQMARVEVYSSKAEQICDALIAEEKPYALSIDEVKGAYSKKPQKILLTNCMFIESAELLQLVRHYDENALFVVSLLKKVDGYISFPKKDT
ncbi:DUF2179 domain-containing protein [[Mycoplasma] testudinis]|uniref:DUF2179 domain-containing protein n=1 Tax=[Mycoplasma] testudinis TaxID=33924 RepID=UPI0004871C59|nr:DUF2179 domain-containing protein [[Mycoplasma] testudinis]